MHVFVGLGVKRADIFELNVQLIATISIPIFPEDTRINAFQNGSLLPFFTLSGGRAALRKMNS